MTNTYTYFLSLFFLLVVSSFDTLALQDNNNGTITDGDSGLIWQQESTNDLSWPEAVKYCDQLDINHSRDWRLPYKQELFEFLQKENKQRQLTAGQSKKYWTLSHIENQEDQFWALNAKTYEATSFKSETNYHNVRCLTETTETLYLPLLQRWSEAWSTRDLDTYLGLYGTNFKPNSGKSRTQWEKQRKQRIRNSASIAVKLSKIQIISELGDTAEIKFIQDYSSSSYKDQVVKVLTLSLEGNKLVITGERTL